MTEGPTTLNTAATVVNSAGVGYAIIGGHAFNAWVEPWFTADVDVTVHGVLHWPGP